jgi:hypothetical protein
MVRCITFLSLLGLLICLGCGKSKPVAQEGSAGGQSPASTSSPAAPSDGPTPTDVVSQFLDQVRRGGEDSGAGQLLTQDAQRVLKQIGRTIQPLGSPDARYQVTRAEAVPNEQNSMLVHSIWSEPNSEGGASDYQVVWAVERENVGWRISGLVMELSAEMDPIVIDFENLELMKKTLNVSDPSTTAGAASSQAAAPRTEISR